MKKVKEKFYNCAYGDNSIPFEQREGILNFLYKKLSKFEINRYQVSYDLLPNYREKILDVGCGNGHFIDIVEHKFKEFYGIDISKIRIKKAKEKFNKKKRNKYHFVKYDVDEGLPFKNSFFDVVSCIAILEHVFNPPNLVEEIKRVLKPKGIFLLQVPNFAWLPHRIQLLFGKLPLTTRAYFGTDWEHLHNFTISSLSKLLEAKEFKVQVITCSGIFAKIRELWPSILGADILVKCIKK